MADRDEFLSAGELQEDQAWVRCARAELRGLSGAHQNAVSAVDAMVRAVNVLTNEMHDVELVEGFAADDLRAELASVQRSLRNIDRIVRQRQALLNRDQ